ncbi:MAG: hypothetical protein Q9195_001244 [Heterodermia aff. obscurata]
MKYVLVSGGGMSGIGKGIIASSTGLLLKTMGIKVTAIKIDPYLNIDAGLMNPLEHGEVFVLDDGGEVDLDLGMLLLVYQMRSDLTRTRGNYERYLQISLSRENNITTGKIYNHVIECERKGVYAGYTVQVVPHITNAVQDWCERVARIPVDDTKEEPDVCIIELGGTVGDIESAPFIESMRQLRMRAGSRENFLHIHVTYVPVIHGEQKTKPTQQAIRDVRKEGLFPDLIACRCENELEDATVEKSQVVAVHDVSSTYHVPVVLESQGMLRTLEDILRLKELGPSPSLREKGRQTWHAWKALTTSQEHVHESVSIALVGKYMKQPDSYLSVVKSLEHAAMACSRKLNLIMIDAEHLELATEKQNAEEYHKAWHKICTAQGILVPGGFAERGTNGMIAAAKFARTTSKPYLGICLGMQIAVIEYARNVCNIPGATSEEFNEHTSDLVVIFMPEIDRTTLGGTMRLGLRPTLFQPHSEWSKLRALYGEEAQLTNGTPPKTNGVATHSPPPKNSNTANGATSETPPDASPLVIQERHRHRYEVNPAYVDILASNGMSFVGKDDLGERMEIMELEGHPWYVGVQYHPEYLSRVVRPSKPYLGFVAAASGCLEEIIGRANGPWGVNGYGVDGVSI